MKTLVSGATGFVGSSVARELLNDGREVKALVREGADTRNIDGLDIEVARGDLTDAQSIRAAMKGCDTVYHVAAMVYFWVPLKERQEFYNVNVEGTKNVCRAALDQGVEKVIYTSTISTIGSNGRENPTNEENNFNLWDMSMDYERSKYSAEFEAWRFAARGLPLVVVMPAAPLGARDIKPNPIGKLILDYLKGKVVGYMEGGGNFIDVDDVARGHLMAARRGKVGERYIIGNQNLSIIEFFRILEKVSGVKAPGLKVPYTAALGAAHLLEFVADRITNAHPLATVPLVKFSSQYYFVDTSKAERELDFKAQIPIEQAVAKAIDWFIKNMYLDIGQKKVTRMNEKVQQHLAGSVA